MKIYTKTGDSGTTSLIGGERVGKDDPRVEAYGTVDELSAFVALLRDSMEQATAEGVALDDYRDDLHTVLMKLMDVQALLAHGTEPGARARNNAVRPDDISMLEGRIDYIGATLAPLAGFTLPGGHPLVSLAHVCRTVCRRAERCAVTAVGTSGAEHGATVYLNRLSDYLYQLSRALSAELAAEEEVWVPTK